jgi:uncharacterized protein (DUF2236 family)
VASGSDRSYFPAGESILRRVHRERAVGLLYGQRALLMQATHPVAFTGLVGSTTGLDAPFKRLVRTAKTMEAVYFGDRAEVDRVTARVRAMHSRVRGTIDRDAGPHRGGTPYAADAPDMLLWILACLADSALVIYRTFVAPLDDPAQRERFWSDYLLVGELFGLPRAQAPEDYAAFRAYMRDRVHSGELYVTDDALEIGRRVAFELPLPARRRPALPAINLAVAGTLPPRVRALYRLPWGAAHEAAFRALAAGTRLSRPLLPHAARRGECARDYDMVARAEARAA